MASECNQFTNEGFDVEGVGHGYPPSYDESNAIQSSAPPQNPYPPPNSSGYPMQQPSHFQQASQFPQRHPGTYDPQQHPGTYDPQQQQVTYAPQLQVVQVPFQQDIVHANMETMPNDYFALALFVTLCCCLPLGIVAVIKSKEVWKRSAEGDYRGAAKASLEAKRWSIVGFTLGCVVTGVCVTVAAVLGSPSGGY